jgi:hypothetical protein
MFQLGRIWVPGQQQEHRGSCRLNSGAEVTKWPQTNKLRRTTRLSLYQLVYRPTNARQDGTYRELRVVLVDEEGQPLRMQDEKKKPLKYDIIARDGYRAKQEVE